MDLFKSQSEKLCSTVDYADVSVEVIKLLLIPFTLEGKTKAWLDALPPNTITIWTEFVQLFLRLFVPMTKVISTYKELFEFKKDATETLG
ncbi:Retrotransposon gag protein [Gossypium australe]|uniref:Retrotransposon gag protein n=1 Tax=Gossypium australe TaxID=47621 RepID=A0A5B6WU87_9ROSI|nr:Retrotransposon gag protein [Gossypium australe]